MLWEIFSWHILGLLAPSKHCLNARAYLSFVTDHVHLSVITVCPCSDFQHCFDQGVPII